jgi:hypothetical protein
MAKNKTAKNGSGVDYYSAAGQAIWDIAAEGSGAGKGTAFPSGDNKPQFANETAYLDCVTRTAGSDAKIGIQWINDFVDVDELKAAMRKYGMEIPKYVVFTTPNFFINLWRPLGWTGIVSINTISINIELLRYRQEKEIVEAIAHETWHLEKQPKVIRSFINHYEDEAGAVGEEVMKEYFRRILPKMKDIYLRNRRLRNQQRKRR